MAIARCRKHPPTRGKKYVRYVEFLGGDNSGVICNRKPDGKWCHEPAVIWMTPKEAVAYDSGERIFHPDSGTTRYRAK